MLSAFIALSLTPALCTLLLRPSHLKKSNIFDRFFLAFNNRFGRFTDRYANGVKHSIKGARFVVIILVCICIGAFIMFKKKPSGFIPPEDDGRLYVTYQLPEASSVAQSVELMTKLMDIVGKTPGVNHFSALSGFNILNGGSNSNNGSLFVMLKPWEQRKDPKEQVPGLLNVIRERIARAGLKNANIVVIPPPPIRGIGQAAGFSMQIQQGNTNDDVHQFENVVKKFINAAA